MSKGKLRRLSQVQQRVKGRKRNVFRRLLFRWRGPSFLKKIDDAFEIAHSSGLRTWSFNMVGIPTETIEDFKRTIDLNDQVKTDFVRLSFYTPYAGTPLSQKIGRSVKVGSFFTGNSYLPVKLREKANEWLDLLRSQNRLWND